MSDLHAQLVVVLHRPRDVRNIGAVVRAMLNFGVRRLRLVQPAPFDPADLLGIAHRGDALVGAIEQFPELADALADVRFVVGTSERAHPGRSMRNDLRPFAAELLARAATGPVALLFGPEDKGLDSTALDHCHAVLSLLTDPAYPSLNLAQAVLLLLYELRMAAEAGPPAPPARSLATVAELEALMESVAAAMRAAQFVKSGDGTATLRRLRVLLARAEPDSAEAALLTALAREALTRIARTDVSAES